MSEKRKRRREARPRINFQTLPSSTRIHYLAEEGFIIGESVCHCCGAAELDVAVVPAQTQRVRKCFWCGRKAGEFKAYRKPEEPEFSI